LKILLARLDSMVRRKKWAQRENGEENGGEAEQSDLPRLYTFGTRRSIFRV